MSDAAPPFIKSSIEDEGFCFPLRAFTEQESAEISQQYQQFVLNVQSDPLLARLHSVFKPHLIAMWADRIAHHPRILDAVEVVLGPELLVWSMDVFRRPAANRLASDATDNQDSDEMVAPKGLDWHQDSLYMDFEPLEKVVRVWLALTPTTLANGTMRYLRGSHRRGRVSHTVTGAEQQYLERGPTVHSDVDESNVVPVILSPGEFAIHDIRTVHDSGVNESSEDRVAVSVTYLSSVVQTNRSDSAMVARGQVADSTFTLERRPAYDLSPGSYEAFVKAIHIRLQHMQSDGVFDILDKARA